MQELSLSRLLDLHTSLQPRLGLCARAEHRCTSLPFRCRTLLSRKESSHRLRSNARFRKATTSTVSKSLKLQAIGLRESSASLTWQQQREQEEALKTILVDVISLRLAPV